MVVYEVAINKSISNPSGLLVHRKVPPAFNSPETKGWFM